MTTFIYDLNDKEFGDKILKSDKPALVDFWAPWCGPCRAVAPVIEELSELYNDRVNFFKINIDNNNAVASQYGIKGIPTIIVFKNGNVLEQVVGAQDKKTYEEILNRATK